MKKSAWNKNALKYDAEVIAQSYLSSPDATIRGVAEALHISKTSVHNYITKHLKDINFNLWQQCKEHIEHNRRERSVKGGKLFAKRCAQCLK